MALTIGWARKEHFPTLRELPDLAVAGVLLLLTAGLLSLPIVPFAGGFTHAPVRPQSLAALTYLILFDSILTYSAYLFLAKVWPPAKAGTYAYWNSVVGILLGCGIRKEAFPARMLPALFLILVGIGLVQVPQDSLPSIRGRRRKGAVGSS